MFWAPEEKPTEMTLEQWNFFQQKFLKNLRIQHDLESKKFKFLNLQVKNKKKVGGYFLKKMHFCQNFTVPGSFE